MEATRYKAGGRAFAQIAQYHPELTALRRELHAHPELGFEERFTAARVKRPCASAAWTRSTKAWAPRAWWP
jgi:metal-dependent amidase/aminoacylase/carboxypeptidase family protein